MSSKRLQFGVDALEVRYRLEIPETVMRVLERMLPQGRTQTAEAVLGWTFAVQRAGRRFRFGNDAIVLMVGPHQSGSSCTFEAHPLLLRTYLLSDILEIAHRLVEAICGARVQSAHVGRLDVFVDVGGPQFRYTDVENVVSRARTGATYHPEQNMRIRKAGSVIRTTGFVLAPGNRVQARLYNKLDELSGHCKAMTTKKELELATYRENGWDGHSPVWRLEFEMRTSFLKDRRIRSPLEIEPQLRGLWEYLVAGKKPWVRVVLPAARQRNTRKEIDPRWPPFQDNPFKWKMGVATVVEPQRAGVLPSQVMGTVWSLLASRTGLPALEDGATVREVILRDFAQAGELIVAEYEKSVEELGCRRAAVQAKNSGAETIHRLQAKKEAS